MTVPVTFIKPSISSDDAGRRIERRWWHRFRCWKVTPAEPGALPRLELVCLPHYLVTVEVISTGKRREVVTTVEAYAGTFGLFDDRLPCELRSDHACFPPRISEAEAIEIARNELQMALLRSRGGSRKPLVGEVQDVAMLQYPYWVYYYERRKGRLDIKVLDAVTGGPPGPKIKASLLAAFIDTRSGRVTGQERAAPSPGP